MLLNLREYHRPAAEGRGVQDALNLLARPGIRTVVLAGGDTLLGSADPTIEAVVDLQGLDLDQLTFERDRGTLHIGALVTRARLAAGEGLGEGASYAGLTSPLLEILGQCAQRWGGNVQRNRATVGGAAVVAADNDPLPAVLLACDAEVVLATQAGEQVISYAEFLDQRATLLAAPAIVTGLRVPVTGAATGYALETVARTPADAPIVLAVAALSAHEGRCTAARLVLGGVAPIPLRVPAVEAALSGQPLTPDLIADAAVQLAPLIHPAGDFRGSGEYRREMAVVLARRALSRAGRS